jgi:hypothetical protein
MVYYLLPRSYRLKPAGPGRHTAQARADPAAGGVVQVSNAPGGFGEFLGNVHRVRRARLACRKREAIQTARPDFCPAKQPASSSHPTQPRGVPDWKGLLPSVDQAGARRAVGALSPRKTPRKQQPPKDKRPIRQLATVFSKFSPQSKPQIHQNLNMIEFIWLNSSRSYLRSSWLLIL